MIRAFLAVAAAGATLATLGFTGSGASVAATPGGQLWTARYDNGGTDDSTSVAASSDGTKVFVTGRSETQFDGSPQYTTVAYNATTGAQLWASRYSGAAIGTDVAVSPDGTKVFVTGRTELNDHPRFATVAYNAATGAQLWAKLYGSGYGLLGAAPSSLAVSPNGSRGW
jgi:DNA-binding beta-propeller fold protein YncE